MEQWMLIHTMMKHKKKKKKIRTSSENLIYYFLSTDTSTWKHHNKNWDPKSGGQYVFISEN